MSQLDHHRSILFLCEFCFEGFDNALDLITHKKQHEKLSGGRSSEASLDLPGGKNNIIIKPMGFSKIESSPVLSFQSGRPVTKNQNADKFECISGIATIKSNQALGSRGSQDLELSKSTLSSLKGSTELGEKDYDLVSDKNSSSKRNPQVEGIKDVNSMDTDNYESQDMQPESNYSSQILPKQNSTSIRLVKIKKNIDQKKAGVSIPPVLSQQQRQSSDKRVNLWCKFCGKSDFLFKSQLINHQKIHTKHKPFNCSHCNKSFTRKSSVKKHLASNRCRIANSYQKMDTNSLTPLTPPLPLIGIPTSATTPETQHSDSTDLPYNCHYCGECYASASESSQHFKKSTTCAMLRDKALNVAPVNSNSTIQKPEHKPTGSSSAASHRITASKTSSSSRPYPTSSTAVDYIDDIDSDSMDKSSSRIWKCRFCRKKYSSRSNAANHERIMHTGEKPFQCSHCDRTFSLKRFLANHEKSHRRVGIGNSPLNVVLSNTESKFPIQNDEYESLPVVSNVEDDFTRPLEPSNNYFENSVTKPIEEGGSLKTPNNVEIDSTKQLVRDQIPDRNQLHSESGVTAPTSELVHIRREIFYNKIYYCCNLCEQKYTKEFYAVNHVRTHMGYKPFKCSFCNSRFTTNGILKMHERCHRLRKGKKSNRMYTCHICGKNYPFKSQLSVHVKTCPGTRSVKTEEYESQLEAPLPGREEKSMEDKEEINSVTVSHQQPLKTKGFSFLCGTCKTGYSTLSGLNLHRSSSMCNSAGLEKNMQTSPAATDCAVQDSRNTSTSASLGRDNSNANEFKTSRRNDDIDQEFDTQPQRDESELGERIETNAVDPENENTQNKYQVMSCHENKKMSAKPASNDKYRCETCDRSFQYAVALFNHQKLHQGLYCNFCGDRFIKSQFDAHVKKCGLKAKPPTFR